MKSKLFASLMVLCLFGVSAFAQNKVSGVVKDNVGAAIGVSVLEEGTTNGTITDENGAFTLTVKPGASLTFSSVGYKTVTVAVGNKGVIDVTLEEDNEFLDEVVVVGYGVQKKKLVTGSTVQVKGDNITKLSTTSIMTALQSQTPGVTIVQQSGQAGSGFKVNIRGIGTVGSSSPLYVIDGVAGGDLNSLNPSDIESIDVLKDAASAAIYGARAANGVILVTTKQGKSGRIQVTYDGYVGSQYLAKMPDVLDAQGFMYAQDLMAFNQGNGEIDWKSKISPAYYTGLTNGTNKGTNWIKKSYHPGALTQNHALNITGGTEISRFSLGFAYTDQDGIFGGNNQSQYQRYNVRLNSDHTLWKKGDLEIIKVGENLTFSATNQGGIDTGNMYWNNMHDLLVGNPLIPAYAQDGSYYTNSQYSADGWNLGSMPSNPLANADTKGLGLHSNRNYNLNMSAYVNVQPFKNFVFKSQFAYRRGSGSYRSMTRIHSNGTDSATMDGASQSVSLWSQMSWENTLSYKFNAGDNAFDFVIGNSLEKTLYGESLNASGKNNLFESDWDRAYVGNTSSTAIDQISIGGSTNGDGGLASFFARANWNYKEKYMVTATVRADGSSNFARGKRWGVFPSVSAGWVMTNEDWMENARGTLDFFKLRGSWGQNGNCNISNFQYLTTFTFSDTSGYYFGADNHSAQTLGGYADVLKNPDVTWETSEQLDFGFDARLFRSRFNIAFDWYKKTTKDWLVRAPILGIYGLSAPYINGGNVSNTGIELGLGWNDKVGDFSYGINVNAAYNKNKVESINNNSGVIHGPSNVLIQGSDEVFQVKVGEPIGYFYGFKTEGVFQNQAQIDSWLKTHKDEMHGTPVPGNLIYVDTNGDGVINADDRTNIGDPHPAHTFGGNITLGYKNFDFSVTAAGAFGQKILRSTNNDSNFVDNLSQKIVYGSWKGEGTSNTLPKLTTLKDVDWFNMSDMWLESGDYVKIQNITFGYNFAPLWKSKGLTFLRLYVSVQNAFQFTKYTGMDPEIGTSGTGDESTYAWASGVDNGFYPLPRTFLVGINIKF